MTLVENLLRAIRSMFQPGISQDAAVETTSQPLRKSARLQAPAVDPSLRAGAKLTQAREILGLTLDEVAERTRVRRDYLEALEAMNMKLLPGRAYAVAYLRSYANALGLEAGAIIEQFQRESALTREDAKAQLRNPESKPRRERPWLAALAIAGVAAGFLGWRAWEERTGDPRLQTSDAPVAVSVAPTLTPMDASGALPQPAAAPSTVVELKALSEAWLEVRGPDGTIFLSRTLQPGDRYRPDVGAGWTIHARDGGAFEVTIDGQVAGLLGEASSPVLGRRVDTLAESVSLAPIPKGPAG